MPTLEAQIVGVTEKAYGWTRIETDSRPQFLDTKREDLIEEARQLMREGSINILRYSERDGKNTNPNTGKPYIDRYYEGAVTNGGEARPEPRDEQRRPEPAEQRRPEPERESKPAYGYRTWPDDAWRMALTSGSERAVQTLPLMPKGQQDFETQKAIALAWADFIYTTPRTRPRTAPATPAHDPDSEPTPEYFSPTPDYDNPPPHSDDDIPF
jgi:hypothetical protein